MPLTAYSTSLAGEHDVEQTLKLLSAKFGQPYTGVDAISDALRAYLRIDLQCPSCFVTGAEIVRSAAKMGKVSRQSYFRFTTPGHKTHCDFGEPEMANTVPRKSGFAYRVKVETDTRRKGLGLHRHRTGHLKSSLDPQHT